LFEQMSSMSTPPTLNQPIPGRHCDSCTLCCKVMGITELQKARGTWCKHCLPGKGCGIYATRPAECRSFFCGWLLDPRLGPEWKPSRSKIVLTPTPDGNGIAVRCDPGFPDAWRRYPFYDTILEWAQTAKAHDGTVIVCVGSKMTVVAPEGEFPLGDVGDDDLIGREFSGHKLVGVRVMKAKSTNGTT